MRTPLRARIGVPLEIKSLADDGTFEGYASLFNRPDLGQDVVAPGAFTESLAKRPARAVKMLYQHDPGEPIGVWDHIAEDAKGLFVRGRLLLDVSRAREVLALIREGAIDGLSIGFKMVSARRDAGTGVRRIAKVDLWEISVVTFPMLPEARVARRHAPPARTRTAKEFERWLMSDGCLTQREAQAFLTHGLRGLNALESSRGVSASIRQAAAALRR